MKPSPRPRLENGRRIPLNVNLSPEVHKELGRIGKGNRSAAVEELVRLHVAARRVPDPAVG